MNIGSMPIASTRADACSDASGTVAATAMIATAATDPLLAPQLDLRFARHPLSGTYLAGKRVEYPYVVTRAFRLDASPPDMVTTIVQSAGGAILGEDQLRQRIVVGDGANAHITSQAALAVHRMTGTAAARETVRIEVGEGAWAEWLPSPRLLFPQSRLQQRIDVELAAGATLILADGFAAHDPGGAGRRFEHYASDITVRDRAGQALAIDRLAISGDDLAGDLLARWRAHGCLLAVLPIGRLDIESLITQWNDAWIAQAPGGPVYAAASPLPAQRGLAVRVAAKDGSALRDTLTQSWRSLRIALTGDEPGPRRAS